MKMKELLLIIQELRTQHLNFGNFLNYSKNFMEINIFETDIFQQFSYLFRLKLSVYLGFKLSMTRTKTAEY